MYAGPAPDVQRVTLAQPRTKAAVLFARRGEALRFGEEGAVGRGGREGKQQPKRGAGRPFFSRRLSACHPRGFTIMAALGEMAEGIS